MATPTLYGPDGRPLNRPVTSEIASLTQVNQHLRIIRELLPDPDIIFRRTGRGPEIWDEMRNDGHIWSCIQGRKAGVLTKEWDIEPGDTSDEAQAVADWMHQVLSGINFRQDLRQMLDAPWEGFKVLEVMWAEQDGRWAVTEIKSRPQTRFTFGFTGDLRLRTGIGLAAEPVPPAKFLVVQHEDEDDENPFGQRLFSKIYWTWIFKKHDLKFWAILLEKYGIGRVIGKFRPGASEKDKQDLLDALEAMVQDAAVAVPSTTEVDYQQMNPSAGDPHRSFVDWCNAEISKATLGQTLSQEIGPTGSYGAAKAHLTVKDEIVDADAEMIMAAINHQLIPWLHHFNFDPGIPRPRFVIRTQRQEVQKERSERDKSFVEMGLPIPKRYFYSTYHIPEPEGDEPVIQRSTQPAGFPFQFDQLTKRIAEFAQQDDRFDRRIGVVDHLVARAIAQAEPIYAGLTGGITDQVRRWSSLEQATGLEPAEAMESNLAELVLSAMITAYMLGEWFTWQDYQRAQEEAGARAQFAAEPEIRVEPMRPEDAIRWFADRMPVDPRRYGQLAEDLRAKAFTIARVESMDLIRAVQAAVQRHIEQGTSLDGFMRELPELYRSHGIEPDQPFHIETMVRNNVQTAVNAGQYESLQQPAMQDMFPYYRYTNPADSRSRHDHAAMNGVVAAANDPIWDDWWPPNGHRCRCGVVPINKFQASRLGIQPNRPAHLPAPDPGFNNNPAQAVRRLPPGFEARLTEG